MSAPFPEETLREGLRLAEQATPRPWDANAWPAEVAGGDERPCIDGSSGEFVLPLFVAEDCGTPQDAAFIVWFANNGERLIRELLQQRDEWRLVERYCENFASDDFRLVFQKGERILEISVSKEQHDDFGRQSATALAALAAPAADNPAGLPDWHPDLIASRKSRAVPAAGEETTVADSRFPFHVEGCICPRFQDIAPNLIADMTCPVHGVDGSDPGDKLVAGGEAP